MTIPDDHTSISRRMDPFHLKHWRFILAAAEEGSFRRAADRLGVQQSTLSRRIRDIEDAMGATLFSRTHAGVRPTFAGRRLLAPVREILRQASHAAHAVERAGVAQDGVLRIGLPPTSTGPDLTRLLERFSRQCPQVRIELVDTEPESHLQDIRRGCLDLMLQPSAGLLDGDESLGLWDQPILIAMADTDCLVARSSIDVADLNGRHFIFSVTDPVLVVFRRIIAAAPSVTVSVAVQPVTREENLLNLVALGQGMTLVAAHTGFQVPVTYRPLKGHCMTVRAMWCRTNPNPALARLLALARNHVKYSGHRRIDVT